MRRERIRDINSQPELASGNSGNSGKYFCHA
jgi:hypothetical protein